MTTIRTSTSTSFTSSTRVRTGRAPAPTVLLLAGVAFAAAAAAAALSAAAAQTDRPVAVAVALGTTLALGGAAAFVDLREHRLPNDLLAAAGAVTAGAAVLGAVAERSPVPVGVVVLGAIIGGSPLLAERVRRGIGMGDVKFAAVLGATGGLVDPRVALWTTLIAAASTGAVGLVTGRNRLALGPWWWAAWVGVTVVMLAGRGGTP